MRLLLWLCPFVLLGCSQGPETSALRALSPEREAEVLGTYAQRLTFANVSELPIVGKSRTIAASDRIVQLVKDEQGYRLRERSCRLDIQGEGPLKVAISDRSMQALAPTESQVTVSEVEGRLVISRPRQVELIGVKLQNLAEELPLRETDARIFDADRDGKPGITASAEAGPLRGQIYMIQRSTSSYAAEEVEPGVFRGLLQDQTEQVIVGTSNFLLNAAKGKLALAPDPDPNQSRVQFVKVPETVTCAELETVFVP